MYGKEFDKSKAYEEDLDDYAEELVCDEAICDVDLDETDEYEEGEYASYGDFAYIYDELMDNVPYEEWLEIVCDIIEKYGVSKPKRNSDDPLESERNLILDMGCGTGTFSELLYEKGYDVIGIDNSEAMLEVAFEKLAESGSDILYLHQDMREFELYCTVGTVVSICDSVNYILSEDELLKSFSLVNNYLYPKGLFIFDFNTEYKYKEVIGDTTIAENRDDCSFIWENSFDEETGINEYNITFFVEEENGLFRRTNETHFQKGYRVETILELVKKAGMEIVMTMDVDTREAVTDKSERVYVVARECGKEV